MCVCMRERERERERERGGGERGENLPNALIQYKSSAICLINFSITVVPS